MLVAVGHYSPITKEWRIVTNKEEAPKKKKKTIEEEAREMGQIEMFPS